MKFKWKRAMEMLLCEMCGEQFDYRTNLNRHQLQHKPLPKFNCGECTKSYRHLRNLKEHLKAKHTDRILTCDKCRKSFTYKNSLVRHLDTIHRVIHCDQDTHPFYSKVNRKEKDCGRKKGKSHPGLGSFPQAHRENSH